MTAKAMLKFLSDETQALHVQGLYKSERVITSPQQADITVHGANDDRRVLNLCANNYLGLADHPESSKRRRTRSTHTGFGLASVRFICGTQDLHKQLEATISKFFGTDDTILYTSCFDANGGLFETILSDEDAVISDALNHASIIDGIRLCKAERRRYANGDMAELEKHLAETQGKRTRLIATDGVFSMDGYHRQARRDRRAQEEIQRAADGRRFARDRLRRPDRPRLGGAARRHERSRRVHRRRSARRSAAAPAASRPAARRSSICCASARGRTCSRTRCRRRWSRRRSRCSRCCRQSTALRDKVNDNALYFRKRMTEAGFDIRPGTHPIAPVMLYDAKLAQAFAKELLDEGIYVIGFFYPVVPQGQARIRTQMSAAHRASRSIARSRRS